MYPKNAYFVDELNFYKKSLQVHKSSARQKISNRTHAFMHENIVDGDHNNSNIIDIANSISGGVPIPLNDLFEVAIPVHPKYKGLLIALYAALVTIDLHLAPRGRRRL